ncbi:MAG TPA: Mur ligase family protein, partial [Solirubrobacteraceae bacterium]|nr:Mur ligase family protein [Solirubrobacteraceae bacterium]
QLTRRLPGARITAAIDDTTPEPAAREALEHADVLVRSPGVSIYKPLIQEARANGLTVTTATGLWLAEREGRHVIGVTGTKGKSTTATVIAHLLRQSMPVELAGNIGRAVIDLLDLAHDDTWVVLELSSYQIADLSTGPEVAVLTNLYREHTDWHGSEERYRADKLRLFDLPGVRAQFRYQHDRAGWHVDDQGAVRKGDVVVVAANQLPLRGAHNAANVATALGAIEAAGLPAPNLPDALDGLQALPHRLQTVHTSGDGSEWIDDSISTTPESTMAALNAFPSRPIVLIAGGQDRGQDYRELGELIAARGADTQLILLPETGARLGEAARAHGHAQDRMSTAGDMREATLRAGELVGPGSVVLLSPAAPSYNAYRNFEERGDDFAAHAKSVALPA